MTRYRSRTGLFLWDAKEKEISNDVTQFENCASYPVTQYTCGAAGINGSSQELLLQSLMLYGVTVYRGIPRYGYYHTVCSFAGLEEEEKNLQQLVL